MICDNLFQKPTMFACIGSLWSPERQEVCHLCRRPQHAPEGEVLCTAAHRAAQAVDGPRRLVSSQRAMVCHELLWPATIGSVF